jgi:hypothetical protein
VDSGQKEATAKLCFNNSGKVLVNLFLESYACLRQAARTESF